MITSDKTAKNVLAMKGIVLLQGCFGERASVSRSEAGSQKRNLRNGSKEDAVRVACALRRRGVDLVVPPTDRRAEMSIQHVWRERCYCAPKDIKGLVLGEPLPTSRVARTSCIVKEK